MTSFNSLHKLSEILENGILFAMQNQDNMNS